MQNYQIKTELNVLVNSTNNKLDSEAPFCRKKLDFQPDKKNTAIVQGTIQSYEQQSHKLSVRSQYPKAPSNSKRNARERRRVRTINDYFSQLQKFLPHTKQVSSNSSVSSVKKMSKVETLKAAIEYIEYLIKFAPANSQQLFQITKTNSSPSSLLSSPTSSISSTSTTQVLADKFKNTLNKQSCSSPSKYSPSSPSTLQNTSNCSTPKSNCNESVYSNHLVQYQNGYQAPYYPNYPDCNYYNSNYYYNNQYNGYGEAYENSNSFNGCYYNQHESVQLNAQVSPVNKSSMSSSSSSISSTGSNFYQYTSNNNEIKSEYYMNECESGLNL